MGLAKLLKAQGSLPGFKTDDYAHFEKLILEWREAVDEHKDATEVVTKAKGTVRKYMAEKGIKKPVFIDGLGTVEWLEEKEKDIVFKKIKRKEPIGEE